MFCLVDDDQWARRWSKRVAHFFSLLLFNVSSAEKEAVGRLCDRQPECLVARGKKDAGDFESATRSQSHPGDCTPGVIIVSFTSLLVCLPVRDIVSVSCTQPLRRVPATELCSGRLI